MPAFLTASVLNRENCHLSFFAISDASGAQLVFAVYLLAQE
jgi:hypothetical protein